MVRLFLFASMFIIAIAAKAQDSRTWSLDECIRYAMDMNISLKQNKLRNLESEIDLKQAKASLFPNLSFNTSHTLDNNPFNNTSMNETDKSIYNGIYSLRSEWIVWDGKKRNNTIKQQTNNIQISNLNIQEVENALIEEIIQIYFQILYAKESVKINSYMLDISTANLKRAEEMYREGSISKVNVAQLESQVSNDKYLLTASKSALRSYQIQLKQILEIESDNMILVDDVYTSDDVFSENLPDKNIVFQKALNIRPEIQSSALNIDNAKIGVSIAKSGYHPVISFNAGVNSNTSTFNNNTWTNQMKSNYNNFIGMTLSLPVFDNKKTKSAISKAKLQVNNAELEHINVRKDLYKRIENIWLDAYNAQENLQSTEKYLKSSQYSFNLINEQFSLGMVNTVDMLTEKNNLRSAEQQKLQAKYMFLLNRKLLDLYSGEDYL